MSPEEAIRRCDENTIGVVPTLGITHTLQYEPVQEISFALDDLEEELGLDIPIHVDAASGGFIAPFIHPSVVWDFRLPRVKSINASGHKFGLAPLGCGWAIWREKRDLPEELIFRVKYLGGNMPTFALNFSRPGGQVVAQYYNFVRLGREGYTKITQSCADVGAWFADQVAKLGFFDFDLRRARRHSGMHVDDESKDKSRFHALRPGRPPAGKRLAGSGVSHACQSRRSGGAASAFAAWLQPRSCRVIVGRSAKGDRTLQEKSFSKISHSTERRRLSPQLIFPAPSNCVARVPCLSELFAATPKLLTTRCD